MSGERFASKAGRPKRCMPVMKLSHYVGTAAFIDWQGIKWFAKARRRLALVISRKNGSVENNMSIAYALQINDNFPLDLPAPP
ncbi:hypothetical protein INH39_33320 [Massilia violaceinigra]|uniref:Transposase DDE domain-containing protein n=1 Tax=Massilia violaceinigra TaxID=2045208 RepID=A0ABY4A988_9BURK|nr:hypothetical protein [Massilia violaceinigra]UOD30161.1 hypothetical protein INH39_33320 [Massilia violaceinigra]